MELFARFRNNRPAWIRVLAVALLVAAYWVITAFPSRRDERRDADKAGMKGLITASLRSRLDTTASVISGLVSISEVGSGKKPVSVFLAKNESGYVDYSYYADRAPVVPGGIMQTATLTYYLDRGAVSMEKSMTGLDSLSVREGFLKSDRYVTDRYVLDDVEKEFRSEYRGFMDNLDRYFGTSDVYYVPQFYYWGPLKRNIASICDGTGIILSQRQILQFYGSIANGGVRPSRRYFPKSRICSEEIAKEIASLLRENVTDGTGRLLKDCPVPVSGKIGTGILDKGRVPEYGSVEEKGEVRMSSFVGFFPSYDPKYVMCVTLYFNDCPGNSLPALAFGDIVKEIMDKGLL
jgi:Cell division protein FtsI/penicillin-binding protein 2